jgi:hypothetical protein
LICKLGFSQATKHPCYRQKKRHKNYALLRLLSSCSSQRRAAKILSINRTTVGRKLRFLGAEMKKKFEMDNALRKKSSEIEFDDLETFEHTKCKPLSVTLAVDSRSRRILGFEVSRMPAKGKLARISVKKYGPRKDERSRGRRALFKTIQSLVEECALIKSDSNPHYPIDVKKFFPKADHKGFPGQRGAITGQGELKKVRFDPLFSLNHTCAMLRANICRLIRKTWCTTKNIDRLRDHLAVYAYYHNHFLIKKEEV